MPTGEQKWHVEFLYVPTGARTVLEVRAGDFIEAHRRALRELRLRTGHREKEEDLAAALEFSGENLVMRIERVL